MGRYSTHRSGKSQVTHRLNRTEKRRLIVIFINLPDIVAQLSKYLSRYASQTNLPYCEEGDEARDQGRLSLPVRFTKKSSMDRFADISLATFPHGWCEEQILPYRSIPKSTPYMDTIFFPRLQFMFLTGGADFNALTRMPE